MKRSSNNSRLIGVALVSVLIVFSLFAILSANSLAWPSLVQLLGRGNSLINRHLPPTGELVVQSNFFGSFLTNFVNAVALNGSGSPYPINFEMPLQVKVTINTTIPPIEIALSNQTDSNGHMVANLTQGVYAMGVDSPYSNFTVRISIVTNEITYFTLNVTQTQQVASFFDLSDRDSTGQVLPSDNIYLEINRTGFQFNSTQLLNIETYQLVQCQTPFGGIGGPCSFYSQIGSVPVTLLSLSKSSDNTSTWLKLTPRSPIYTSGVQYVALSTFTTSYHILITNSTGGFPIA